MDLYDILQQIRKRPKMFLARCSLKYLNTFLNGYVKCMNHTDPECNYKFYPGFQEFIQKRYNITTEKHWVDIIEFYNLDDEIAFEEFFKLLDEFLAIKKL